MNSFQSHLRLKITLSIPHYAHVRAITPLSPSGRPGCPNHNKTGKRTMRMISEKAVALLLAVVISGTAFNTFIV